MARRVRIAVVAVTAAAFAMLLPQLGDYLVAQQSSGGTTSSTTASTLPPQGAPTAPSGGGVVDVTPPAGAPSVIDPGFQPQPFGKSGSELGSSPSAGTTVTTAFGFGTPSTGSTATTATTATTSPRVTTPPLAAGSPSAAGSPAVGGTTATAPRTGTATTGSRTTTLTIFGISLLGLGLAAGIFAKGELAALAIAPARWRHRRRRNRWWRR